MKANVLAVLAWLWIGFQGPNFQILTANLPPPQAGQSYEFQLQAKGGIPPYHWTVSRLPPGLTFDPATAVISGTPSTSRTSNVLVDSRDSSQPPLELSKLLPMTRRPPLELAWIHRPAVEADHVSGSIRAKNQTGATASMTLIATALNQVGKAFALAYQHGDIPDQVAMPNLEFSVFLPAGHYRIEVDAVAEIEASHAIFREHLSQTDVNVP